MSGTIDRVSVVGADGLTGTVELPDTWVVSAAEEAAAILLPADLGRFAGDAFMPSVTLQVVASSKELNPLNAGPVLADRWHDAPHGSTRVSVVQSPIGDQPLLMLRVLLVSGRAAFLLCGTATARQWAAVAPDFDHIATTAAVAPGTPEEHES